jgi:hypothetical protein
MIRKHVYGDILDYDLGVYHLYEHVKVLTLITFLFIFLTLTIRRHAVYI